MSETVINAAPVGSERESHAPSDVAVRFKAHIDAEGLSMTQAAQMFIKPATVSSGLYAGWCAPSSFVLGTCSTIGATVHLQASGDFRSSGGTSSTDMQTGNFSGLHADGHGNWSTTTDTANGGAIRQASYALASLPTANETDGNHLWCSDCTLNGVTGVEVYWHASAAKWTDSQNNALVN